MNWKETTDYPDWIDAENTGVSLSDEELKVILFNNNQKESELEDYSHLNDFQREYSLRSQRNEVVNKAMDEERILFHDKDKLAGHPY